MYTYYVAGFLFSEDHRKVALIQKARPEWQAGKLNGIGGHIEANEVADQAIHREFKEETGVEGVDWKRFTVLRGVDWAVYFYYGFGDVTKCQSVTDEQVVVVDVDKLPETVIPNLRWLIPLALDPLSNDYKEIEKC